MTNNFYTYLQDALTDLSNNKLEDGYKKLENIRLNFPDNFESYYYLGKFAAFTLKNYEYAIELLGKSC